MAEDTVSYIFQWNSSEANQVIVTGTFDNWSQSTILTKSNNRFFKSLDLPIKEKVLFKYVVDGNWITDQTQPIESDGNGIENNVIYPEDLMKLAKPQNKSESTLNSSNETLEPIKNVTEPINNKDKEPIASVDAGDIKSSNNDWLTGKASLKSLERNNTKQLTDESSVMVSNPNKKEILQSQKSNTEEDSSVFTNIETPSHPEIKEVENGVKEIVDDEANVDKEKQPGIVLNSLHLDDLESAASFKSISSNEMFSSTHGSLSHFNNDSQDNVMIDSTNTIKKSIDKKSPNSPKPSGFFLNKFKRIFK